MLRPSLFRPVVWTSVFADLALLDLLTYNTSFICSSFFSAFPRLLIVLCLFWTLCTTFEYHFLYPFYRATEVV